MTGKILLLTMMFSVARPTVYLTAEDSIELGSKSWVCSA